MSARVTRQKDFVAISTENGELMASFEESRKIRDELMREFPPTLKEIHELFKEEE